MISFTICHEDAKQTTTMKINQAGSDNFKDEIFIFPKILILNEHRFKIINSHVPKLNKTKCCN